MSLVEEPSSRGDSHFVNGSQHDGSLHKTSSITLHAAPGTANISSKDVQRAIFTLHIGTVVLSDEAVISFRDMQLVLTWKFYDQNIAMSHMHPGRVVHFDFSTEYDLKLSDHFLSYLKNGELHINVCQVNNLDLPLASCSLPLREALLHTNRRADLSLALVAGPGMVRVDPDALDTRDEVGVLDLWCMLRAESHTLPRITKAIGTYRSGGNRQSTVNSVRTMSKIVMTVDEQDEGEGSDRIADLMHEPRTKSNKNHSDNNFPARSRFENGAQTEIEPRDLQARGHDSKRNQTYGYMDNIKLSKYPVLERSVPDLVRWASVQTAINSDVTNFSDMSKSLEPRMEKKPVGGTARDYSEIIVNEVPTNIKTFNAMKDALTRNYTADPPRRLTDTDSVTSATLNSVDDILLNSFRPRQKSLVHEKFSSYSDIAEFDRKYSVMRQMLDAKNNMDSDKRVDTAINETKEESTTRKSKDNVDRIRTRSVEITILWLALNEESAAMHDRSVQRLYVAYNFLGRGGAELETPLSLPKPKTSTDKCVFNFKKSFQLTDTDLIMLARMASCRSSKKDPPIVGDSVCFTVVSEPSEDLLGLNNCEDIGTAHMYFGDMIDYSGGSDSYTDVLPVHTIQAGDRGPVCGVLAIRVDGLDVVRKSLILRSHSK